MELEADVNYREKLALVEKILTRTAEEVGDIVEPVMSLYYRRLPDARSHFERHARDDLANLEGEMVERALYCLMTWFESPGEIDIMLSGSVPHHQDTLQVPPQFYLELINATADVIEGTIPPANPDEAAVWRELRSELRQIVENSAV